MNESEAKAELQCLSANAKLWLEDRVGNRLQNIASGVALGVPGRVDAAVEGLMDDMKQIGCFPVHRRKEDQC